MVSRSTLNKAQDEVENRDNNRSKAFIQNYWIQLYHARCLPSAALGSLFCQQPEYPPLPPEFIFGLPLVSNNDHRNPPKWLIEWVSIPHV